ncbi:hypothetical protein PGB90_005819 [Kerria lacca]
MTNQRYFSGGVATTRSKVEVVGSNVVVLVVLLAAVLTTVGLITCVITYYHHNHHYQQSGNQQTTDSSTATAHLIRNFNKFKTTTVPTSCTFRRSFGRKIEAQAQLHAVEGAFQTFSRALLPGVYCDATLTLLLSLSFSLLQSYSLHNRYVRLHARRVASPVSIGGDTIKKEYCDHNIHTQFSILLQCIVNVSPYS